MPTLTVNEKERWKERIAWKIDKKIETVAATDPGLLERIAGQARQRALRALGLAEMQAELDGIDSQKQALDQREQRARRFMLAIVRRVSVEDVSELSHGSPFAEVTHAIEKLQSVHEEELLDENLCGKEILRWRREKEHLQDTIWLATSPAQVKSLWQRVMELLGEEQTVLQKEALAMGNNGGCD